MISIYLSEKAAYVLVGKINGKTINIKNAYECGGSSDVAESITEIIKKINNPKEKYSFIIDSKETSLLNEKMHCVSQRHLNKTLEKVGIRSGKPVHNQLDAIIDGIESKENIGVETTAKITTIPKSLGLVLQNIVTNTQINYEKIEIANTAEIAAISALMPNLVKNFVLMNYKSDFASVSVYADGKQINSYNVGFTESNDGLAYNRLAELGHRAIIEARANNNVIIQGVYVVGDIVNMDETVNRLYNELTVKTAILKPSKHLKGLTDTEFNKYFPAIGGLAK